MVIVHKIELTFFPRFQDGSLNWGNTTTLPTLSYHYLSVRVKPAGTKHNPSLPGLEEQVWLPIDLSQQCSEPVPPVHERRDADLTDGFGGVAVVHGLPEKAAENTDE